MLDSILAFDRAAMLFIQDSVRGGVLDYIMIFFTTIGNTGAVWLFMGAVMAFFKKTRKAGICVILSVALCYVVNDMIIKELVRRPRPFLEIPELVTLVSRPGSFSFPSGHSCAGFAASYALTKNFGRKGAPAYILAVIIAVSRPYVGVHYISDIVVGTVVGTVGSVILNNFVFPKFEKGNGETA